MIILQFLGLIILFVVVFFIVALLSVVFRFWGAIRQLLGLKGRASGYASRSSAQQTSNYSETYSKTTRSTSDAPQRKKIIPKDEGEYVDFEEV